MPSKWVVWTAVGWLPFILIYYGLKNDANQLPLLILMICGLGLAQFVIWKLFQN